MAQVPYREGAGGETSRLSPVSSISVNTPADAFGASLARALGQEGSAIEGASDEIFKRAQAMQQLENEAKSRDAQATYMQQQGQLHAEFGSLQGSAAGPQALKDYTDKSRALRDTIRQSIDSPAAAKMFDADSMGFLSRNIFSAAGHSASQMKSYSLATSQAVMDNNASATLQNPADDLQYKAGLEEQRKNAEQHAADMGFAPGTPGSQSIVDKEVSKMVSARISGFARTDPAKAQALLDDAVKNGQLRGQDIVSATNLVQNQTLSKGPKAINDSLKDGTSMALGQGKVSIERAMDGIKAAESFGGDYSAQGPKITNPKSQYFGQQALGAYQVMPGNLPQWLKDSGLPPMTPEQFLKNPEAQDKVFATKFGALMEQHGSFNKAANAWFTGSPNPPATANDGHHTAPQYLVNANAGLAKNASLGDKVAAGQALAKSQYGDKAPPGMDDAVEGAIEASHRRDQIIERDETQAKWGTINQAIVDQQGVGPATIEELRKNPKVSAAIDELPPKDQAKLQSQLVKANANDNVPTPERDQTYQKLNGIAHTDPDAFKAVDPYNANLTADQRKSIVGMQAKMRAGGLDDTPSVRQATAQLATQMTAAGLDPKSNKEDYDLFTGALAQQIRDFKAANQRPPQAKDIDDIGRRLLTEQVTSKGYIWDTKEKPYAMTAPEPIAAKLRVMHPDWNDQQVNAEYVRRVYQSIARKEKPNG